MSLFSLALRHLRRHWRMNIAVLLGLTLAVALLASLPVYAVAVAARELDQDLQQARPTERNLLISGTRHTFNDELYERLRASLGEPLKKRLVVRQATLAADPLSPPELTEHKAVSFLDVYSFDKLPDIVRPVEGRLPVQIRVREAGPHRPAPVEAVIGTRAAELTGYGVGDRLTANKAYHRLDIVGIVEPLDPHDDIWAEDLSAFSITIDTSDPNADTVTLPLIIASTSMRSNFNSVPIFRHSVLWRILLNHRAITVDKARAFHADLINLQTQLGTRNGTISTGLVRILADYLARLAHVRTTLFLRTAQAFIFVLYSLTVLTSFVLDRSQVELATLSGRGASAWQITLVFALEYLILALPAALLFGPVLAGSATRLWAASSGEIVPATLPRESWLLSGLAAGLAWLALVLPVYPAARRNALDWQGMRARPPRLSAAQKLYLDLFLLAAGALLYWQLNQSGSFVTRRLGDTQLADPLLLIGPSLLLVAIAMIFLRLFPYLLRLIAWAFQRLRGLMLPLGFHRLARDPLKPGRVVLLISLASGLILFTNSFGDSLSHSQEEMAHYLAGADLRVSLDQPTRLPIDQLTDLPGVLTVASVFRTIVQAESGQPIHLFAVDPSTFGQVARYPASLTDLEITTLMHAIHPDSELAAAEVPAAFSYSALPDAKKAGDLVFLNLGGQRIPFGVRGSINNFPTLSGPFVIVSLPALEARVGLHTLGERLSGTREAWMTIDPAQREDLIRHPTLSQRILDDTQVQLHALRSDALTQGTSGAFQLNTLTMTLLSVTAFMLVHFFAAQGRVLEFGVLRAMGLSVRQLLTLLVTEGILVIALGLVAGTIIGYGMVRVMIPYLSQALSASLAGATIKEILVDWPAIARMYLLLIACYGLALLLLLLVLLRAGVHQALRVGDE
jgi:putative ABC transport system permease protein